MHIQYSLLCIIFETELTLLAGNSQTNTSGWGSLLSFRPLGLVFDWTPHFDIPQTFHMQKGPNISFTLSLNTLAQAKGILNSLTHHQIFTRSCTDSISLITFQPISSSQVLLKLPEFRLTLLLEGLQHPPPLQFPCFPSHHTATKVPNRYPNTLMNRSTNLPMSFLC